MKGFLPLLLLLFLSKMACPQGWQSLSVENGLSNSTTFSVIQDEKGLMWFSTKEGIDRYDGSGFKHYDIYAAEKITRYGLRRNKFHLDSKMQLWVNNFSDVFLYNKNTDTFAFVCGVPTNNTIRDLYADPQNNRLLLATDKGLLTYNYRSKTISSYSKLTNPIVSVSVYSPNILLVSERNRLLLFDLKMNRLRDKQITPALEKEVRRLNISVVHVSASKKIYIGSTGEVLTFNLNDQQLKTSSSFNSLIDKAEITKIVSDKSGSLYIGTEGKGIYKVTPDLKLSQAFLADKNNLTTLPENEAADLFVDQNNSVWIAGREISYINNRKPRFGAFKHQTNNPNSLVHNSIRSITEDDTGNLWIGTNYGISILGQDKKTWKYVDVQSLEKSLLTNKITALARKGDTIVAGTNQNGLLAITNRSSILPLTFEQHSLHTNNVNSIFIDGKNIWYGGASVYLKRLQTATGDVKTYPITNVLSITKNLKGQIITGGHNGLHLIDGKERIKNYNSSEHRIGSIFCVLVDRDNRIWLGSEGQGLIEFIQDQGKFKKYTTAEGLPSNLVYGVLEDDFGNLWLSTTNGLSCFNKKKQTFRNYSIADGLQVKEFGYGAYAKTSTGELAFGGNNGLILFHPRDVINDNFKTRLFFTDFKLFNRSADVSIENSPLRKAIDETSEIKLDYDQNAVTLDFTCVNFSNTSNLYSWKLDGLDKEWSPPSTEHSANYTNLKPGTYLFRVRWNNSGFGAQFSTQERQLTIIVSPPFWATTWAYLFYIALTATVIYFIFRFYHVQLSELHAKDKIRFFINIAHDIRTPLSLIKSPLSIALKQNDFSKETQDVLKTANHNASRLTNLIDQLLDFEEADLKKMKLKFSSIHAEETLDKLSKDFIPLLEQRGIILITEHENTETLLRVDRDKFDKIIFNILSNAVKYTLKGGQIKISTAIENRNFLIKISDSGLGIPEEQQKHIFKRYFRAKNVVQSNEVGFGIGLMVTRELVKLHGGDIWFESELNKGTTFFITFKMADLHEYDMEQVAANQELPEALPEENSSPDTNNKKKPRILIAEDNEELRNLMSKYLAKEYVIYTASDGIQALAEANKLFPDVIVSDVMMPKMNGNEFCFEIKSNIKTSHIPFILLTALTTNEHKIEGYKIGADSYLEKPFDLDLLSTCINNLLESRKKLRDKFSNNDLAVDEGLSELDKQFISKAVQITEANLANEEFSIEMLEKEIGMSHAGLYRKFKGLLGKTPLEFINQYRLKKAVELLISGEYNVNEVAYQVGFSDPKYFSTVFKKYFGKNASEYLPAKRR